MAALKRLETLPPPVIHAPAPERMEPARSSVPNNDGDRVGISGPSAAREPQATLSPYLDPLAPPLLRSQAFSLRAIDDGGPWSLPGTELVRLAAMVRYAVHRAAQRAGLDATAITELMGHGGDGRVAILPVPNAGHRWADGRVRRVLVAASPAVAADHWDALQRTVVELKPE
ncbi:CRISPR-associated protein, GSU0054 family [Thioalkalivibrio nitratireducens DSM 14787]|uniref:CRISPR-associated protein, GSU0054 family n=1 Tax=Thioalkalivibrio nitratireducens (strain DSM 14787 / UNIQEM 213 / ALEN2) TaxID=1255043 RepID=L0E1U9_THIND|nr:CRISPR-associated protein, GSU0054 family [Thioalkalivibrio nitratireducens]AGA35217.1 CRISPR-associated protein, GSU0054 family [Thioalkalivibrio nitratireducens DSM 14787]